MNPLERLTRVIEDWPIPGVSFQDLTGVLASGEGLNYIAESLHAAFEDQSFDVVAGMEARGFIVGTAVAMKAGVGFIALRKEGKLPGETVRAEYELEYGSAAIEVHSADVTAGLRVLIIDDVLATGGTALAACELVESCGGVVVGAGFVLSLDFLGGRDKLAAHRVVALSSVSAE
jgi:adenine phosphoribosyltransferase